jgi:hypothetical protein
MNSEQYLNKLRGDGDLVKQLKFMASEYTGPGGQSVTVQTANQIKRQALLDAVEFIEQYMGVKD